MAIDDLVLSNIGQLTGHLSGSFNRWAKAALKVRANTYTPADLWTDLTWQFNQNWDTWSSITSFPGYPVTPTCEIHAAYDKLKGQGSTVYVRHQLSAASFKATDLLELGGANTIGAAYVTVAKTGTFDGGVQVTLSADAPARGVYRGLALADLSGGTQFVPLAWIIVAAN